MYYTVARMLPVYLSEVGYSLE